MTLPAVLCLAAAVAAAPPVRLPLPDGAFTLAWTHSIEKVAWEEDYLVAGGWLFLLEARVHGSGAGMEVPDGAVLSGGVWHYRPAGRWHRELRLTRSPHAADYRLCVAGACRELGHWVPLEAGALTIVRDCAASAAPRQLASRAGSSLASTSRKASKRFHLGTGGVRPSRGT